MTTAFPNKAKDDVIRDQAAEIVADKRTIGQQAQLITRLADTLDRRAQHLHRLHDKNEPMEACPFPPCQEAAALVKEARS